MTTGITPVRELSAGESALLPMSEREREFGSARRRRQHLCGRALLRLMLEEWTGRPAAAHRLESTREGKPVCVGGPAVSITHAGELVACCIADRGEIGIDLEAVDTRRDTRKLARKFFSSAEADWLETRAVDDFYMLWVLKEAYVKALGKSIFGSVNRLRCTVEPPDIAANDAIPCADLLLFTAGTTMLGLATTEASLRDVRPARWLPGSGEMSPDETFSLLAARYAHAA